MNPRGVARGLRVLTLAICLVLAYQVVVRYRPWNLHPTNDSMLPAYPPGTRVLIDYRPRPPILGDVVLYELDGKGRTARVAGVGGDRIEVRDGLLHVNGVRTVHPIEEADQVPARILAGELLLLNDNPDSPLPDSLVHGPVPATRIRGRILTTLDFL